MARPTGVMIASERYWAFAEVDGGLVEGEMPRVHGCVRRAPLVRGLVRLAISFAPVFRGRGVSGGRERLLFGAALALPLPIALLPDRAGFAAGVALTVAFVVFLLRGRTLSLHGAEHRAIAAAERSELLATWAGEARPSRFARRCGTNFAALLLPTTFGAQQLSPFANGALASFALMILSLAVTMELWQVVQASPRSISRIFLAPGLALQRLTTREPTLAETRLALRAVAAVLEREGATRA